MDEQQARTYGLIQAHLDATVPLLIRELLGAGGPTEYHYQLVREHGRFLAEHGDAILYPQKGKTSEAMNRLVEGVAILAFCPGGIRLFGCEFDARRMSAGVARRAAFVEEGQECGEDAPAENGGASSFPLL